MQLLNKNVFIDIGLRLAGGMLTLALLPSLASASALAQFKIFVSNTQSAKGDFTQRLIKTAGGDKSAPQSTTTSSGNFIFARPGKFIWIYLQPYEQVLQADGDKLYIYDKDLNQVTIKKLGNALGSSPAAILFGSNDLEQNFILKEGSAREGLEWLEVTPKAKDTTFDHIRIGMRNGIPEAMELQDAFGQMSLLSFTNFVKNPPLSADRFKFVPPKGVDVFNHD